MLKNIGKTGLFAIIAIAIHGLVIAGFVAANLLSQMFEEEPPPPEEEQTEIAVLEPAEKKDLPPPEAEPEPLPVESFEPAFDTPADPAAPQIGISAESTVEGGTGPAFRTGSSLAGAISTEGLAQEILGKDPAAKNAAKDMVMTGDTVDTQPKPLGSNRRPVMPAKARRKGTGGFVVVRMLIDKDGSVRETTIMQAQPPGLFEEKVLEVVPTWRFTPATYQGEPVVMRVEQTIRFDVG
jgi:protein TonB